MKQSEKVLVYLVTVALVAILAIAFVFGREPARNTNEASTPQQPSQTLDELIAGDKSATDPNGNNAPPLIVTPNVPPPPTAAEEVQRLLGPSNRDRDYRTVTVKHGDSWTRLAQRWCPGAASGADLQALNEHITDLRAGTQVTVYWVDDEALLASARPAANRPIDDGNVPVDGPGGPANGAPVNLANAANHGGNTSIEPAVHVASRDYEMKSGESLWKVAEREVGANKAQAFIDAVKALNPEIEDLSRLRAKQKIRLPAKG
jgi:hypothetical protein